MSPQMQWLFYGLVAAAIIGTVRMRYKKALETGETRSGTPLRTYADLRERCMTRLLWCFLPASAIAIWLWVYQQKDSVAILTIIITGSIVIGGVIFDYALLRAWDKRKKDIQP